MGGVTARQIETAKSVDILEYVLSREPQNVRRVGNEYRLKDHSITISNGKWHWQSRGFGGATATALNYLITVRGYSFVEAVEHLAGGEVFCRPNTKPRQTRKPFKLPPRNRDNKRVIAYLRGRGIDEQLIRDCIQRGALYESNWYHNCVFVGRNERGRARYASMRGTVGDFKLDVEGSDKRHGFVLPPSASDCDTVAIFESPIDSLSHKTLFPERDVWRLSLGGTALLALSRFLAQHGAVNNIVVCTDNDKAGDIAAAKVAEVFPNHNITRTKPLGKDWNDDLKTIKGVKILEDKRKDILFIDSHYNEKFRVKDGDSVKVTIAYDGEVTTQKCRHIDETHLTIGGNTYHICELAERLAKNGNVIEPIPDQKPMLNILAAKYGEQLRDVEIPMTKAAVVRLLGGAFTTEDVRGDHIMLRGKDGVAVCKNEDGALAPVHPYWAQTLKRELGIIAPPPDSLRDKLDSAKAKVAARSDGERPKNHTKEAR